MSTAGSTSNCWTSRSDGELVVQGTEVGGGVGLIAWRWESKMSNEASASTIRAARRWSVTRGAAVAQTAAQRRQLVVFLGGRRRRACVCVCLAPQVVGLSTLSVFPGDGTRETADGSSSEVWTVASRQASERGRVGSAHGEQRYADVDRMMGVGDR